MQFEHTQTLQKAGLSESQAIVYEALLTMGSERAGNLAKHTPLKRTLVYRILEDLSALGLIEKEEKPGAVALFTPKHPSSLRSLVEKREEATRQAQEVLGGLLPTLTSRFNLKSGAPGVLVYEGKEGIEKVLNDSLNSKTEILTYADIEPIVKYIDAINRRYASRRDKLGIDKRALLLDTPFAREYMSDYHRLSTDVKLVTLENVPPFQSAMEIYDNRVAYITFAPDKMMGVIIHDPYLYEMHKYLFEYAWKMSQAMPRESRVASQEENKKVTRQDSFSQKKSDLPDPKSVIDEDTEDLIRF